MGKTRKKWMFWLYFVALLLSAVLTYLLSAVVGSGEKELPFLPCSEETLILLMRLRQFLLLPLLCFLVGLGITGAVTAARQNMAIPWIFSRICLFACILLTLPGLWWGTAGFTFRYFPTDSFRWYLMTHRYLWNLWWTADGILAALVRRN